MSVSNDEYIDPDLLVKDAAELFQDFSEKLHKEILDVADTTRNGEVRITNAFVAYCQACVDHGFGQTLLAKMKGLVDSGAEVMPSVLTELSTQVEEYRVASNKKALDFLKMLRAEGFATSDINDFSDDIKTAGNNGRLYGAAQAIKSTAKD